MRRELMQSRFRALDPACLDAQFSIEPGSMESYRALARFHYRGGRPGGVRQVWHMMHREAGVVGVLVVSLPALACRLRDCATNGRYAGRARAQAAALLNREVRTISRVVIDPRVRSLGLGVRLVRHALAHAEADVRLMEALAVMGRINPFFERAGMTRYEGPSRPEHERLEAALERAGWPLRALADPAACAQRLAGMPDAQRRWLEGELARWHRAARCLSRAHLGDMTACDHLRAARDMLVLRPVYYAARLDHAHHASAAQQQHANIAD